MPLLLLFAAVLFTGLVTPVVLRSAPPKTLGRKVLVGGRICGGFVLVSLVAIKLIALAH